jgi:hypothetical protein
MLAKLRSRLTYANVMATLGVFIALGGTAYAVNTVGSTDIIDGQVKSVDVGDNEINSADVKDQSLSTFDVHTFLGVDVVDNTLTGDDVDESTLNLAAGPWHEVGAAGEPPFGIGDPNTGCVWSNYGGGFNTAGFVRDRFGFVHLKGLVKASNANAIGTCENGSSGNWTIFVLPVGYRPANRGLHVALTNNTAWRVDLNQAFGDVEIAPPTDWANVKQWISLDGISFRCAPSGSNGCP